MTGCVVTKFAIIRLTPEPKHYSAIRISIFLSEVTFLGIDARNGLRDRFKKIPRNTVSYIHNLISLPMKPLASIPRHDMY